MPLHRICTLARKQQASVFVVETAIDRANVIQEVDTLDAAFGGGGAAEAIAISFFRGVDERTELFDFRSDSLIGQLILINYRAPNQADFVETYIFEAILRPPTLPGSTVLLNNHLCPPSAFVCTLNGRSFPIEGFYYCQQNRRTHVCAHACLRMLLNQAPATPVMFTNEAINTLLAKPDLTAGLTRNEVVRVIEQLGDMQAEIIDCSELTAGQYLPLLSSVVESGDRALLVFTTHDEAEEHVVTVFGYTRNSDEWHPQAMPVYAGPQSAPYYSSSMWIDHFLIHDDNFGPYFTLSSRTLETETTVKAHVIIALRRQAPQIASDFAQALGSIVLSSMLPSLATLGRGKWINYITRNQWPYVLRTILISKVHYLAHLKSAVGHDKTRLAETDLKLFAHLPDQFWMVEYSLPALFTGNRSKLGEVLISCAGATDKPEDLVLALRAPSLILAREEGGFEPYTSGLEAHSEIYRPTPHDNEW